MRLLEEQFNPAAEARAFIAGIELVNNSDVAAHEPRPQGTQWTVDVPNWAAEEPADVFPFVEPETMNRASTDPRRSSIMLGIEFFENLHSLEPEEAALKGTIEILGVSHHAWFIQVEEGEDGLEAVHDPHSRLEEVVEQNGDGDLETVQVPGFPGRYVLSIYPFAR